MIDFNPKHLREKAAQCRSVLQWMTEEKSAKVLRAMADELEAKAQALEAQEMIPTKHIEPVQRSGNA